MRSSKPVSCLGGRSLVFTTCLSWSWSVLKVWKKRLLRLGSPLQELDVVDEEDVDIAIPRLERRTTVVRDGVVEVVRELFARDVPDADAGVHARGVVTDGVQKVRLAQTRVAVDEQRVVGLRGCLGDRDRGGVGEAVGLTDDEVVERVLRVQSGVVPGCRGRWARAPARTSASSSREQRCAGAPPMPVRTGAIQSGRGSPRHGSC